MTARRESLREHLPPHLDEARRARQHTTIMARVARPERRRAVSLLLAAGVLAAAVIAFVVMRPSNVEMHAAGAVVEAPSSEPLTMTLIDGSRVILDPASRLRLVTLLARDVRLELDGGEIDCDVTHVEGREFVVVAGGYEIRVLGTRFRVRVLPRDGQPVVEVTVARGRVRVTRSGDSSDTRVLGVGETWSAELKGRAVAPVTSSPSQAPDPPATTATGVTDDDGATPEPGGMAPVAAAPARGSTARELWGRAQEARTLRRFKDEAAALDELRRHHRSDARAGVAAFELGRLRQDTLHDPHGAAEAFADAVVLAPHGPFREDAEARRIEALEAAGRWDQCADARTKFLARYPAGVHTQRVTGRCQRP